MAPARWCRYLSAKPTDLWARRQGRVTTIWIDHGPDPVDASYAYVVRPNTTAEEAARCADAPSVQVQHHDANAHVVTIGDRRAAAFFAAGEAGGFTATGPAILYLRGNADSGAVAVQDPLHGADIVDMSLPVHPETTVQPADDGISAGVSDDGLHLQLAPRLGRIYRAGWGDEGPPQPAIRVDLADFYAFRADVEADTGRAVFTVRLGSEPLRQGYELHLQGRQGHLVHIFTDADRLDEQADSADDTTGHHALRYLWRHGQLDAAEGDRTQREGDFRLMLYTDMKMATAYVSIPHFYANGTATQSPLPRDANRKE